jgi:hypothetical protein
VGAGVEAHTDEAHAHLPAQGLHLQAGSRYAAGISEQQALQPSAAMVAEQGWPTEQGWPAGAGVCLPVFKIDTDWPALW